MLLPTVRFYSTLMRFPAKIFVGCSSLSTNRLLPADHLPNTNNTANSTTKKGQPSVVVQDVGGLLEYNRLLAGRSFTEIKPHRCNWPDGLTFRAGALCYAINGMVLLPSSQQNKRIWVPDEAKDRRNWQLCIRLKTAVQPKQIPSTSLASSSSNFTPTVTIPRIDSFILPIHLAQQLLHRLEQLEKVGGDGCAGGGGVVDVGDGLKMDNQRLSGPLFGLKQSAFYLTVCHPSKKLSAQPLVFLSEHALLANHFHAWHPVVNSIPLPLCCLPELRKCLCRLIDHPAVSIAAANQQQKPQRRDEPKRPSHIGPMFFA